MCRLRTNGVCNLWDELKTIGDRCGLTEVDSTFYRRLISSQGARNNGRLPPCWTPLSFLDNKQSNNITLFRQSAKLSGIAGLPQDPKTI